MYTVTALVFTAAMLWESFAPRRKLVASLLWRWTNNFSLAALNWYLSALVGTAFLFWLAQSPALRDWRLLEGFGAGPVVGFLMLLTVTQFLSYWLHRAYHALPWLWPIHAVHHSDIDVDVSTSYRHHPLEPLISIPLIGPVVIVLGASVESIAIYRLFEVAATVFSHSNLRIPEKVERYLRWVVLTPDYHRLHHCAERQYTNSNYGSLVPWFDYLFGTARSRGFDDQETMPLGLEYLRERSDTRLDQMLLTPLRKFAPRPTAPGPGQNSLAPHA